MACVIVGSETSAEYTESSGVVMGPTGRGHPTANVPSFNVSVSSTFVLSLSTGDARESSL